MLARFASVTGSATVLAIIARNVAKLPERVLFPTPAV
jgi:hypothetical protein